MKQHYLIVLIVSVWYGVGRSTHVSEAWQFRYRSHPSLSSIKSTAATETTPSVIRMASTPTDPYGRGGKGSSEIMDDSSDTPQHSSSSSSRRRRRMMGLLFGSVLFSTSTLPMTRPTAVHAIFDGGIGGLGKTRPETGVVFVNDDTPAQQQTSTGMVSAELLVDTTTGTVALVSFQSPWPLLATSMGLETRDQTTSDAAFCQVVSRSFVSRSSQSTSSSSSSPKEYARELLKVLELSVLAPQGKFGMYGAPSNIRVKPVPDEPTLYMLSFTTLTPGMRESDRKYYVSVPEDDTGTGDALVLLLVGSTAQRFASQKDTMKKVAKSWQVALAPKKFVRR